MPLRFSNSTSAEVSHTLEMASASRVTRSLGASGATMIPGFSTVHVPRPVSAATCDFGSGLRRGIHRGTIVE